MKEFYPSALYFYILRFCCNFEDNSLHFCEVAETVKMQRIFFKFATKGINTKLKDNTSS